MALTKNNFYRKEHDHKANTQIECEEHGGRLVLYENCPHKCKKHLCNDKQWIVDASGRDVKEGDIHG